MRARFSSIVVVCALAGALGAACSGGGGGSGGGSGDGGGGDTTTAFPQGFLPARFASGTPGRGDVAFRAGGDLYVVDGSPDVSAVSRANGAVTTFANDVDGGNAVLRSIVVGSDGRVFTGDNTGKIWVIPAAGGSSALLVDTATGTAITGLAVAPSGFGSLGGSLIAAAGTQGIVSVTTGASPAATVLVPSGNRFVDVAFSGTTLFALDATSDEIDTVTETGTVASFQAGFANPMGMAVDDGRAEILVADAGTDVLRVVPLAGGAPTDRAPYDFDASAPSGIAYDGTGAIAFVTKGSVVVRGSAVPRIDAASPNFGPPIPGPTVGYGDLELDRDGQFVLVGNDTVDPQGNFLFRVSRDGATTTTLASNIGAAGEQLLSLAIDPATQAIYIGTDLGNVFRRSADGTVSLLVSASANAVLGLELAPAGFGSFGGHLIATTSAGEIFAIDPQSPNPPAQITPNPAVTCLNDLVFASDGTLYAVENDGATTPHLVTVAADGTVTRLSTGSGKLGRPDGIEIDEGGKRLLVTSFFSSGDQLLAVALSNSQVTQLASIDLDFGINPTGIVYDRLGTAIVRGGGEITTTLDAVSVFP
jgi:sugar lactone lactonase YvrE